MEQAHVKSLISKISSIIFVIAFILNSSYFIVEKMSGNLFFFHGISSRNLHWFFGTVLFVSGISFFLSLMRNKNMIFCVLLLLAIVLILLWCFFPTILTPDLSNYVSLSSPDGTHTVIVQEFSVYHGASITFYQKVSTFFMQYRTQNQKLIEKMLPISDGHYSIEWKENAVIILLNNEQDDITIETVTIQF